MARFITTIQLHNAEETDYQKLNAELERASFRVTGNIGKLKTDLLKKSEYNREGNITLQEVTEAVVKAAEKTGKKFSFTIIRNKPVYN